MALDLAAIRAKLDRLSGANRNRNTKWKPTEGEKHTVRIISFPNDGSVPDGLHQFRELQWYYNIPGVNYGIIAPFQFGKPDPVQELITKLREEGSKESYEMAKKLYPSNRIYAAVIVRGQEDEGVKIWGFGKTVYQKILQIMLDEDYGDITDPLEGRDITVTCTKPPGKQYASTDIMPRPKITPLSKDSKQAQEWIENVPTVDSLYELQSYDKISGFLDAWINGDEGEEASEGTEMPTSGTSSSSSSTSYSNLDDAFADLMD